MSGLPRLEPSLGESLRALRVGAAVSDVERLEAMRRFAHDVAMALTERKVPDEWDAEHLTPAQMLEATAYLLDRLDDATDRYIRDRKADIPPVSRQMQADLRALARRTESSRG